MKNKPNITVVKYLDYYIKLPSPPEFAVLLRGNWGCGKTWFIKEYIKQKEKKGIKFIYISLYGISSFTEINDLIFEQVHPILGSKGMKITSTIFKGILKSTINFNLNKDPNPEASFSPSLSELNLPSFLQNLDDRIMVFDDLERCKFPIKETLGFINQFSENKLLKVIILGNENELIKGGEKLGYLRSRK